tara:strand:- start:154 stop:939 length:786 start_codon:yes stop_codon:yes gene_type:complete
MKKIAFLGYNKSKTNLINSIENFESSWKVTHFKKKVTWEDLRKFNSIISFGYQHIIEKEVLRKLNIPIINLHIGYLPYNRGSHPNFWSFIDNTPSGVSIHEIDENIDTGNIIFQKQIDFNLLKNRKKLTFSSTYKILMEEIEKLFIQNINDLINGRFKSFKQMGVGSFHEKKQLLPVLNSWDQNVYKTVRKAEKKRIQTVKERTQIINKIENTRKNNNINWMNLVRNSLKSSPQKTIEILKQINVDDNGISKLFKELTRNR